MTTTDTTISYWNDNAKYQKEFSALTDALMPDSGEAETIEGELIRIANRYYWDYCNNGNMNLLEIEYETEEYCAGYDEDDEEIWEEDEYESGCHINEYYEVMLELVRKTIPDSDSVCNEIENLILNMGHNCQFNQFEYNIYNEFVDTIVEYVLSKNGNYSPFNGY